MKKHLTLVIALAFLIFAGACTPILWMETQPLDNSQIAINTILTPFTLYLDVILVAAIVYALTGKLL